MDAVVAARSKAVDLTAERSFPVGAAIIDPASREARFGNSVERLQPQHLKVLIALARQSGRVVTRNEIVDCCWNGRFTGDDVINRAISTLRQFAARAGGFQIETVPRAGYRLVEKSTPRKSRHWLLGATAIIALALAGAAFMDWPHRDAHPMPTIAILPFVAPADASERDLAIGARGAVAHTLSQTEYRVRLADSIPQGARGTPDFVVSGDVSGSSEKIVVTVRVDDTIHDAIVYSNRFETDRAKAGDLPDQIGAQIAGSLGRTASLLMLDQSSPSDPAITAELFRKAVDYQTARQVAATAPNSVIAQTVLAFSVQDALPDLPLDQRVEAAKIGRRAFDRIQVLAPGFGGSEIIWCLLRSHARIIECENHLRAGMRRDPDSPWLTSFLAYELKDVGRTDEALQLSINSLEHDPYAPGKIGMELRMLEAVGRHDESEDLYRDARKGWPEDFVIFWDRVYGMMDRGDFEGLDRFNKELQSADQVRALSPALPVIAAVEAKDSRKTRRLCPPTLDPGFRTDLCMLALGQIGDMDDAFALAFRIYPNRIGRTPAKEDELWLESGRFFDSDILMGSAAAPLRGDPRYLELVRRLGVLAYWRSGRMPDFCRLPRPETVCRNLSP